MSGPTVCLVHGAWHGAWCWEHVATRLDDAGVAHVEVDLPFTGHDDDIAATRSALDEVAGPKVLVGHSYGGLVISGAGTGRDDIEHLIYVAAMMVAEGKTVFDDIAEVPDLPHARVLDAIRPHDDGTSSIDPELAREAFYLNCPREEADRAVARLRPMVESTVSVSQGSPWLDVPSTYVLCEQDRAIPVEGQRHMARQATHTVTLDTDHSPFTSMPNETARILIDIATPP